MLNIQHEDIKQPENTPAKDQNIQNELLARKLQIDYPYLASLRQLSQLNGLSSEEFIIDLFRGINKEKLKKANQKISRKPPKPKSINNTILAKKRNQKRSMNQMSLKDKVVINKILGIQVPELGFMRSHNVMWPASVLSSQNNTMDTSSYIEANSSLF